MIFVTLGSQKFQFNRLLKKIDELISNGTITGDVIAQIGYSDYRPIHYKYKEFFNRDEFASTIDKCDIVITHGGTGAIIGAVKKGKKVIAVPRLIEYCEHVDNHQFQIIEQFTEMNLIYGCKDCEELTLALDTVDKITFEQYQSNKNAIIGSLETYIENI